LSPSLTAEWQAVGGVVNRTLGAESPRVQYAYTGPGTNANYSRPTSMTYPNARVVGYTYASGIDDAVSRPTGMTDGGTTLESFSYLGAGTVVERTTPSPGWT